jgi:hypothetical protein
MTMRGRSSVRGVKAAARGAVVVALVAAVVVVPGGAAQARSLFPIGCDETSSADEDALRDAITDANDETHHPGEDLITLTAGCTYTLDTEYRTDTDLALPPVTSTITLSGRASTIVGPGSPGVVGGLFRVESSGDLSVLDLSVTKAADHNLGSGSAFSSSGALLLERTTLYDNLQSPVSASGTLTVKDSVFKDNRTLNRPGGAIRAFGSVIIDGTLFDDNFVGGDFGPQGGGALFLDEDSGAFITDSTFTHQDARQGGGAIQSFGSLAVTRSTFTLNNAGQGGGAIDICCHPGALTVTDSYFAQNFGAQGGAIDAGGSTSISNSTFYANSANFQGGAVRGDAAALTITNSTFSSNLSRSSEGSAIYQRGTIGHTTNSLFVNHTAACYGVQAGDWNMLDVYDASCPGNMVLGDAKLQAPADNGGATKTMRLGSGSAAVDRITSGCPSKDQRGYSRPAGPKCDIGAYEDQAPTVPGTPVVTAGGNPSKTGALTLGWAASTDADDTVSYRVLHKDANDAAFSVLTTTTATSASFTEPEGTWTYVVEARDGNHAYDSGWSSDVVVDKTRPSTPTVSADRAPDHVPTTGTSWYRDTVTVTTTGNGDPALADSSPGSGVASVTAPATYSTSGTSTYTGTATDGAGNVSLPSSLTVSVDAESPTASFGTCPATVLLKHAATASWSASDPSSGLSTAASGSFALDTATIGHKSVSTTASDNVGHSTTATCAYDVVFDFTGFFTPLANPPAVVKASAGQNLSIAFSLAGNQGLGVLAPGYPLSAATACNAFGAQTSGTPTTAVKPGLTFSSGSGGRYVYVWKTSSAWRGTCRQLVVKLSDGTYHRANISFG